MLAGPQPQQNVGYSKSNNVIDKHMWIQRKPFFAV